MTTFINKLKFKELDDNKSQNDNTKNKSKLTYLEKINLLELYRIKYISYQTLIINSLIANSRCHLVAQFNDYLIANDNTEVCKQFYSFHDSYIRLKSIFHYYQVTSILFPNYTPLPESIYIYKNIIQKQKLIDELEALENIIQFKQKKKILITKGNPNAKFFDTQNYDDIMNQSNSILKNFFGLNPNQQLKKPYTIFKEENSFDESEDKINLLIEEISKNEEKEIINSKLIMINPIHNINRNENLKLRNINMTGKKGFNNTKRIFSPLKNENFSIKDELKIKSKIHSRNISNNSYFSTFISQFNSYGTLTKQNKIKKLKKHNPTLSIPKIASWQRTNSKIKIFQTVDIVFNNNNMGKMRNETHSGRKINTKFELILKKSNINFKKLFNIKEEQRNFYSPPITERAYKTKSFLYNAKLEIISKKVKLI